MRALITALLITAISCGDNNNNPEGRPDAPDIPKPQCSDGIDNDGDGDIDFPDDLGCDSDTDDTENTPPKPQCSDNRDNDGDGLKDFPNDPGCDSPLADSETDDCPDGPNCPQCANGRDDDANGKTDFPADPGCTSAADPIEFFDMPTACGASMTIKQVPASGIDTGVLDSTSTGGVTSPCGGGPGSPSVGYVLVLAEPKVVVVSTDYPETMADTVIDIRGANCSAPDSEIACHDDISTTNRKSKLTASLPAGVHYIIIASHDTSVMGPYKVSVEQFAGQGATCAMNTDCGPGLECRIPFGGTTKICTKPVCSDGLDDDQDGKTDYPSDPGCESPTDGSEEDDCPAGPNCPECADGQDNDGDGQTDYPNDTTCKAASGVSEACTSSEPIEKIVAAVTTGTTVGAIHDHDPTCNSSSAGAGPDRLYQIDLPALQSFKVELTNLGSFDSVTSILNSTCGGAPVACTDSPTTTATNLAAGRYFISVDAWNTGSGSFTMTVSGKVAPGGSCEHPLFAAGALSCATGFVCDGTPGARTCRTQCSDGIDNNGDGRIDYPMDPGCSSPADNSEDTVCPGPNCPQCSDGIDNDGDGFIDYPADTSCSAAGGSSESCQESDPIEEITTRVVNGTTIGATNDYDPTCNSSTGLGPDRFYSLTLPKMASLTLDVSGFDTVTTMLNSTCGGAPLFCSDPQSVTRTDVLAGQYYVGIESYGTTTGDFTLTTTGVIANGGSCEHPLFAAGAFTCNVGYACTGAAGSRTCELGQCQDGIDNNGDGKIDYPNDPGCISSVDLTEDTVCPGTSCPECADGIDNDLDGHIDYPADPSCLSASGTNETCAQTEPILAVTTPTVTGTTVGKTNDYRPACGTSGTHTAPDVAYQLDLPGMKTLNLNLTGLGSFDSVHALLDSTCGGTPLACNDASSMTVSNVAAGRYFLVVDGYSSGSGSFTLNTSGVIAGGQSCEHPLFAAGAFTCDAGFSCNGPAGSRTCAPLECRDGIDNNGDGLIDFPFDPGCSSPNDATEDTVCPGANCPACANGMDDDADTLTDYPADFGCYGAGGTSEAFCPADVDYAGAISMPSHTGTLAGAANNFNQSCQSNTGNDRTYSLQLPVPVARLQIDTNGSTISDSVLSLKDANCGVEIACDDDAGDGNLSMIVATNVAMGNYAISVDSYQSSNNGAFKLNVKGTVAVGTACTSPLFASGVLVCPTGSTCTAGTCQAP